MQAHNILTTSNNPRQILSQLENSRGLPFSDILPAKNISEHVGNINYRQRVFTPDITIWSFLSQMLSKDQTCQGAVARVIAFLASQKKTPPSSNTAAYCKARSRLPEQVLSNLARESAEQLEEKVPSNWLWRNRHIKLIDGSTLSMSDTKENQKAYPQHHTQKKGVGFPIIRIVTVTSFITGAILDLSAGSYFGKGTGEHSLLRQLMHAFNQGDIVIGDAYYASFFLIAMLIQIGVDVVFPIYNNRNRDFRKGKRIGKYDHIVQWKRPLQPDWMDQKTFNMFPRKITIREIAICNNKKGFRSKSRIIATTFLDEKLVSKQDLAALYDYRWCVELDLRSIKDVMQMGILRGKSPELVRKEIWARILAYNLIRNVMAQAAIIHNKKPRELSFKLAFQVVEAFRQSGVLCEKDHNIYCRLMKAIVYKKVGNRAGRQEPRMVKRRPKPFPLLQEPRGYYLKKVA